MIKNLRRISTMHHIFVSFFYYVVIMSYTYTIRLIDDDDDDDAGFMDLYDLDSDPLAYDLLSIRQWLVYE